MKLSAIIITYNEEENIERCLSSLTFADEIIIVDSFSCDKTLEVAKKYTSNIFQRKWDGFAKQKNFALQKAKHNWILWVDADEVVTSDLQKEIKSAIESNKFDGFYISRKNFFCGKWIKYGGWYPDWTLRLFRKEKAIFEEREVHEKVILDGKTSYIKSPLLHYTYKSIDDYIKRQNLYSSLAAKELSKKNKNISILHLMFKFLIKFLETYIYKMGFMDGKYGFFLSLSSSYFATVKLIKTKNLQ